MNDMGAEQEAQPNRSKAENLYFKAGVAYLYGKQLIRDSAPRTAVAGLIALTSSLAVGPERTRAGELHVYSDSELAQMQPPNLEQFDYQPPEAIVQRNSLFFPSILNKSDIRNIDHPTVEPPTPPVETTTPPAETATPTATQTATATERPPFSERVPVPTGAKVCVGGPNAFECDYFINGDRDSGAAALGYTVSELEIPFRYGEFVVGQRLIEGDDPKTAEQQEEQYFETVYTPATDLGLTNDELAQIPNYDDTNPEHKLPVYNHVFWNGTNGKAFEFFGTGANDGANMVNGAFQADFSRQKATLSLEGSASSANGRSAYTYIYSWDEANRDSNFLVMEFNSRANQWILHNHRIDRNISNTHPDADKQNSLSKEEEKAARRQSEIDALAAADWGAVIHQFPPGQRLINFDIEGSEVVVDGQRINLAFPPTLSVNHWVRLSGDGSSRPNTTLKIQKMALAFDSPDGKPLQYPKERLVPSLTAISDRLGLTLLSPPYGDYTGYGAIDLTKKTGQWVNNNQSQDFPDRRKENEAKAVYGDQNIPALINLHSGDRDQDLLEQIDEKPGGIFQLATTGTLNGPTAPWFDQEGKLTVADSRLYNVARAVIQSGGSVLIDPNVPLRLTVTEPGSPIPPNPMNNVLEKVRYLLARGIDPSRLIVTFSGDESTYNSTNVNIVSDMVNTLSTLRRDLGIQIGLMHIRANETNDGTWFSDTAQVALDSNLDLLGFESPSGYNGDQRSIMEYSNDKLRYSPRYDEFREALVIRLSNQ